MPSPTAPREASAQRRRMQHRGASPPGRVLGSIPTGVQLVAAPKAEVRSSSSAGCRSAAAEGEADSGARVSPQKMRPVWGYRTTATSPARSRSPSRGRLTPDGQSQQGRSTPRTRPLLEARAEQGRSTPRTRPPPESQSEQGRSTPRIRPPPIETQSEQGRSTPQTQPPLQVRRKPTGGGTNGVGQSHVATSHGRAELDASSSTKSVSSRGEEERISSPSRRRGANGAGQSLVATLLGRADLAASSSTKSLSSREGSAVSSPSHRRGGGKKLGGEEKNLLCLSGRLPSSTKTLSPQRRRAAAECPKQRGTSPKPNGAGTGLPHEQLIPILAAVRAQQSAALAAVEGVASVSMSKASASATTLPPPESLPSSPPSLAGVAADVPRCRVVAPCPLEGTSSARCKPVPAQVVFDQKYNRIRAHDSPATRAACWSPERAVALPRGRPVLARKFVAT